MNITEGSMVVIAMGIIGYTIKQLHEAIKGQREDMKELDKAQEVDLDKIDDKSVVGDDKLNVKIEQVEARCNEKITELRGEHIEAFKMYRQNDHKIFDLIKKCEVNIAVLQEQIKCLKD